MKWGGFRTIVWFRVPSPCAAGSTCKHKDGRQQQFQSKWQFKSSYARRELLLCLSRACLGKLIVFSIKWRTKGERLPSLWVPFLLYAAQSLERSTASRALCFHIAYQRAAVAIRKVPVGSACTNCLFKTFSLLFILSLSWQTDHFTFKGRTQSVFLPAKLVCGYGKAMPSPSAACCTSAEQIFTCVTAAVPHGIVSSVSAHQKRNAGADNPL